MSTITSSQDPPLGSTLSPKISPPSSVSGDSSSSADEIETVAPPNATSRIEQKLVSIETLVTYHIDHYIDMVRTINFAYFSI
jgi:hypothetical protein